MTRRCLLAILPLLTEGTTAMDTPRNPQEAMVAAMIALGLDPLSVAQVSIQIVMLPPTFPAGPMLTGADFDALTQPGPDECDRCYRKDELSYWEETGEALCDACTTRAQEREPTTLDELIDSDESTLDDPADE